MQLVIIALFAGATVASASGSFATCERKALAEADQPPPACNPIDPTCGALKGASEAKKAALSSCLKAIRGVCARPEFERVLSSCPKELRAKANGVYECACPPLPAAPSGGSAVILK
jgi:hypothetical protein